MADTDEFFNVFDDEPTKKPRRSDNVEVKREKDPTL